MPAGSSVGVAASPVGVPVAPPGATVVDVSCFGAHASASAMAKAAGFVRIGRERTTPAQGGDSLRRWVGRLHAARSSSHPRSRAPAATMGPQQAAAAATRAWARPPRRPERRADRRRPDLEQRLDRRRRRGRRTRALLRRRGRRRRGAHRRRPRGAVGRRQGRDDARRVAVRAGRRVAGRGQRCAGPARLPHVRRSARRQRLTGGTPPRSPSGSRAGRPGTRRSSTGRRGDRPARFARQGGDVVLAPTIKSCATRGGVVRRRPTARTPSTSARWRWASSRACSERVHRERQALRRPTGSRTPGSRSTSPSTSDRCARSTCPTSGGRRVERTSPR